ncbi:MAG: hypothetical protein KME03_04600 [Aphanocapsa lilacina HA4352-LM1]|jgi:hypothetical protein|nr:hypothetical protein [Aphanocapsa lilacina HA4352-LM1]
MLIPEPLRRDIFEQLDRLLRLIDDSAACGRTLFGEHGENTQTIADLAALDNIVEEAQDTYRRLWGLMARIARDSAQQAADNMRLLEQAHLRTRERLDALSRSVREIKTDWGLP